jgi:hypothetical protein
VFPEEDDLLVMDILFVFLAVLTLLVLVLLIIIFITFLFSVVVHHVGMHVLFVLLGLLGWVVRMLLGWMLIGLGLIVGRLVIRGLVNYWMVHGVGGWLGVGVVGIWDHLGLGVLRVHLTWRRLVWPGLVVR